MREKSEPKFNNLPNKSGRSRQKKLGQTDQSASGRVQVPPDFWPASNSKKTTLVSLSSSPLLSSPSTLFPPVPEASPLLVSVPLPRTRSWVNA